MHLSINSDRAIMLNYVRFRTRYWNRLSLIDLCHNMKGCLEMLWICKVIKENCKKKHWKKEKETVWVRTWKKFCLFPPKGNSTDNNMNLLALNLEKKCPRISTTNSVSKKHSKHQAANKSCRQVPQRVVALIFWLFQFSVECSSLGCRTCGQHFVSAVLYFI